MSMKNYIINLGKTSPTSTGSWYYIGKGRYKNSFTLSTNRESARRFTTIEEAQKILHSKDFAYRLKFENKIRSECGFIPCNPIITEL